MTFLFDEIIFGPVKSRRFGVSLGVNLLPLSFKYCTFNCVYCECGWTKNKNPGRESLPDRKAVWDALEKKLNEMKGRGEVPDNITFAGNGEPTIHPEFDQIIEDTIALRNRFFPEAEITVLSNATQLHKEKVFKALSQVDNNVLKIDSVVEETFQLINKPAPGHTIAKIIENIKRFDKDVIIQTLLLRGQYDGQTIDNTTPEEVNAWLEVIREINPAAVMLYPIERDTAASGLVKISRDELMAIAKKVKEFGITTKVYA